MSQSDQEMLTVVIISAITIIMLVAAAMALETGSIIWFAVWMISLIPCFSFALHVFRNP